MNDADFDKLFDQALEQATIQHQTTPDPTASWKRVEGMLRRQKKKSHLLKMLPYIAASFVLGAVLFGSNVATNAFPPFFHGIESIQKDMYSFVFGTTDGEIKKALTSAPTDEPMNEPMNEPMYGPNVNSKGIPDGTDISVGLNTERSFKSWEEARPLVLFSQVNVNYIPKDLNVKEILLFFHPNKVQANQAVLIYTSDTKRLLIKFDLLEENQVLTATANKNDGTLETIQINNTDAYLYVSNNGDVSLQYMTMNLYISISGNVSKEEIIQVANNIK
ncbi:DUF4367 domain-containing protein [Paenibacillus albiflavus]|uniref:DUF4367 domain-containing protein n=1 Tax=Paenibacillus albiflavus TaxID=2545760 RepID=A0A4R4EJM0_9BACL|nr:DUF4367 domain-containing protein [Paenibacillus albiflavus]TCZ80169.1 DUF4367 domain-containing protein [Paenibacillus albiflavus]